MAGCAKFHPQSVSPVKTAAALESRQLDNLKLKEFLETCLNRKIAPWPVRDWDFPMLTLAAMYYHPDPDVARTQWQVAEAGIITAGQRPNPIARFTPEYVTHPWPLSCLGK